MQPSSGEPEREALAGAAQATSLFHLPHAHPLHALFEPRSVAVIGATERAGSVGRAVLWNLISHPFGGTVFPVNVRRSSVLGLKAYPRLQALPEPVDLAVIATPASTVPTLIADCVDTGVKAAVILSAGFRETGPAGLELEQRILEQARRGHLRLLGPNCLGVMNPLRGLNATFARVMALPGSIAFLSQSGALCSAILDWSLRERIGFSSVVSVGSLLDVGWGDLLAYLGDDPQTRSILLYLETLGDAGAFLSTVRAVARRKPVILLKAGRAPSGLQAAISHTGALAARYDVVEAACHRCGVLLVDQLADLFALAEALAHQPHPQGPRLTIVTNAGGAGVLAADALAEAGGELAPLAEATRRELDKYLPAHWSHQNPVDLLGDADPERYARAVEILLQDPTSDGLLIMLTPQAMSEPTRTAERLQQVWSARHPSLPVLACWMGGSSVAAGQEILAQAGIPTFASPEAAVRVFCAMWRHKVHLTSLYETPWAVAEPETHVSRREQVARQLSSIRQSGRSILSEPEAKALLRAYGIPTVETLVARTEEEAVQQAETLGFPVVLKLLSEQITHKSAIGGVQLWLHTAAEVREAYRRIEAAVRRQAGAEQMKGVTVQPMITAPGYELIVGSFCDPQFGPVLLFGAGGRLVEVQHDHALALPPLTTTLARRLMERTQLYQALARGTAGIPPVKLAALERVLVSMSMLLVEQPLIKEIDINPLLATGGEDVLVLDARVVLHPNTVPADQLPRPAIRPYPLQYVGSWHLPDGTPVVIRPIRPEDEPLMVRFHETLSERTVYLRWLHMLGLSQRTAHERLVDRCFIDYERELALVALWRDPAPGQGAEAIIAIGRLIRLPRGDEAEFALLVSDRFQRQGVGSELLRRLIEVARQEGLKCLRGYLLPENRAMQQLCRRFGFRLAYQPAEGLMEALYELG
ncbi:GNAT family N-acetyltransferase [Thermogemmatispora sp.]|uniref:bifunctional acetate--CoA ligase family protein/GNAT family N-acetyltransferase n=1 Tax=Thermogemmatispora sp. TaxID=1968838 RepID=UPI0035E44E7A